jgi:NhaP-type Na+/H+ or K+/H+ antiporter
LQESSIGIILGIIVGFIFSQIQHSIAITFRTEFFFQFLLPSIIFAAGYNLKRRRFFKNFGYIFMFGILGTLVSFFTIFGLTYAFGKWNLVYINKSSDPSREGRTVYLGIEDCLYLAAATCATDTVASLSVIKQKDFPKLFSIVFGESITKNKKQKYLI